MAQTSNMATNKIFSFLRVFKGNKGLIVHGTTRQASPHSSSIHFISPMPIMSLSCILTSKHQKLVFIQYFDFYRVSCSYYRSFL